MFADWNVDFAEIISVYGRSRLQMGLRYQREKVLSFQNGTILIKQVTCDSHFFQYFYMPFVLVAMGTAPGGNISKATLN